MSLPITNQAYVRIPRIDSNGRDNTISLQQLNSITINFPSGDNQGLNTYIVYSISEYPDFYLYQIYPNPATSSISPAQPALVILNPYLTENFEFSDCNVLYGNVDSYVLNSLYMDVDYSTNGMIAVNTDQIIAGTAYRSTVKPYYYSLKRHIIPRYNGSKNIDKGVFEFSFVTETPGNVRWSLYVYNTPAQKVSYDNVSKFKPGDNIIIYQQNGTYKGIGTIIRISQVLGSPGYFIVSIASPLTSDIYNTPLPIARINSLFTGSFNFDETSAGIAYLVPNTYENSNIFPIDTFNPNIFEYQYGATCFPEIPNAGVLVMGNILEVADKDNVNVLRQSSPFFEAYNKIINDTFVPNTVLTDIRQYTDKPTITLNEINVLTPEFGTPITPENAGKINEYWIPTNGAGSYLATGSNNQIIFTANSGAYQIERTELNQYSIATSGEYNYIGNLIPSNSIVNKIISDISRGERWFATIYSDLPNPLNVTSLTPYQGYDATFTVSSSDDAYPLLSRGVYEITSGSGTTLYTNYKITTGSATPSSIYFGDNEYGLILWRAQQPSSRGGKYIIVSSPRVNELEKGAIVLPDSNNAINTSFNEITTTFGSNPKPPTNQPNKGSSPGLNK